jgi:hypothetical protein
MEPEGSLPCSQKPSTGPYPEPDQSNLYHPIICFRTENLIWIYFGLNRLFILCKLLTETAVVD